MISILLLLVLAWGFYIGYRRGLVLQVYYFLVAVISAFVAGQFINHWATTSTCLSLMPILRKDREPFSSLQTSCFI